MIPFNKSILLLLFISTSIKISNAQISFTNSAYGVTDDVVKIERYTYLSTSVANAVFKQTDFDYSYISSFKNGRIQKQVNDGPTFILTGQTKKNYLYNDSAKEYSISGETYKLIEFGNLFFSYPKKGFKIISKSNTNLELQYNDGYKSVIAKYHLLKNGNVEEITPDLWNESKSVYNTKGLLIEWTIFNPKKPSEINQKTTYTYFHNNLLNSREYIYKNEKKINHYYYTLDSKGNWINQITITKTPTNKSVTYSTRKLTYKDSSTSGSITYNTNAVSKLLKISNKITSSNKNTGCISGDCQNGFGTYKSVDGLTYIGSFKNGKFNGTCTVYDKNNRLIYEGNTVEGDFHGQGTRYYENGDIYEGNFNSNLMEGYGRYSTTNGDVYDGDFKNGLFDGNGMFTLKNGDASFGVFKDNKMIGKFTTEFANGDVQYSTYIDGKREGESEYIFKSGKKIIYNYKDDKIVNYRRVETKTTIPDGLVWTKNATNTEYFLYKDGVAIEDYTFWVGNSLYVYLTKTTHQIYLLKDFKIKPADSFHNAELLAQDFSYGAWFKTSSGGLGIYNSSCTNISTKQDLYQYASNGIDVLFRETGKKEILLLKNFKNATVNKVYPVNIYDSSKTTSNNATGFQAEINTCKNEKDQATCLYNKFFTNYDKLKESGIAESEVNKTSVDNLNLIGRANVEALFNILMDRKKFTTDNINKIIPKIDNDLKAKVKVYAQKVVDDYAKTHNMN